MVNQMPNYILINNRWSLGGAAEELRFLSFPRGNQQRAGQCGLDVGGICEGKVTVGAAQ